MAKLSYQRMGSGDICWILAPIVGGGGWPGLITTTALATAPSLSRLSRVWGSLTEQRAAETWGGSCQQVRNHLLLNSLQPRRLLFIYYNSVVFTVSLEKRENSKIPLLRKNHYSGVFPAPNFFIVYMCMVYSIMYICGVLLLFEILLFIHHSKQLNLYYHLGKFWRTENR